MAGMKALSKLPMFDGKKDSFQVWWMKFTAYAMMMKFTLSTTAETNLPAKEVPDNSVVEMDANKKARERNATALYCYTMCGTTHDAMSFIYDGQTDNWPSGLAWMIFALIQKKFRPIDNISKVEVKLQLHQIKSLNSKEDPTELFKSIRQLRQQNGRDSISDDDIVTQVIILPVQNINL
jgi:hypothetical protein